MTPYTDALEVFNRASFDPPTPGIELAPAEDLQADVEDRPRTHPLATSLWLAAGCLFVGHIIWVARGMPVPAFLSPVLEMLNV